MRRPRARRALASLVFCAIAVGAATTATAGTHARKAPTPKRVTVADFYFGPSAVTIKQGGAVKWVWAASNAYPHDVHLKKGPKGLKNKGSYSTKTSAVTNAHFQRSFATPGTYNFICTIHPTQMKLTVKVTRRNG